MAVQLTLRQCGVALLERSQDGTMPGPKPRRGPPNATDCGSDSPEMVRGEQSSATDHQLRIAHWNAESVRPKKMELQKFLNDNKIDVCCIQETHLKEPIRFGIRGFEPHRNDRADRPKGGVITLVNNKIPSIEVAKSKPGADSEYIGVKLLLGSHNMEVYNIYNPSKTMDLEDIKTQKENFLVCGDFDSHSPSWGYHTMDKKGEELEEWMVSNNLILINKPEDSPTYFSRAWKTSSTPDLAMATDDIQKITEREVGKQLGGSDHKPVILTINKEHTATPVKLPPCWNYKKANWDKFKKTSDELTQGIFIEGASVDKNASSFTAAILEAAKATVPRGRRRNYRPYWNSKLDGLQQTLNNARDEMERDPCKQNTTVHKEAKEAFDEEKKLQSQKNWFEKTSSLNLETDTKKLWNLTKALNDDKKATWSKTVIQTDKGPVTDKAACNIFAQTYKEVSEVEIPKHRLQEVRSELKRESLNQQQHPCMSDKITMRELNTALWKLKLKKAPGPDDITNDILKHIGSTAKRTLLSIFNQSWHTATIPSKWKEAIIRPVLKKGKDKRKTDSYRPISLLSCVGKLLERIINSRLMWHLESQGILSPTQTGYRQHRSTEDQLAYMTQEIEDSFQEKKKTLAVFFDMSKAFDNVWKEGLLLKLKNAGISGKMFNWIRQFLHNRTARVRIDGSTSNLVKLKEGVPQGGVISPTLFLVYINDLTSVIPKYVSNTLHADDLAVWCSEEHVTTATLRMQETIDKIKEWTDAWALTINQSKTVSTLFSLSTKKESANLKLNGETVKMTDRPTFLGVTLDQRLTWKPQLENMENKAIKRLALMKKLSGTKWGANSKILRQVYTGNVRPVIEYASSSWATASKTNKSQIDKVQNMGLRIIHGAMKSTPITSMEQMANIQPLEDRRMLKIQCQGEKSKRLPSHPLHTKLNQRTKNRIQRKSLNHLIKDLQRETPGNQHQVEELQPRSWRPQQLFEINKTVSGIRSKSEHLPNTLRVLTLETIDHRYPSSSWIQIYTDGSADDAVANGGSGMTARHPNGSSYSCSKPVGTHSSNFKAEIEALTMATEYLSKSTDPHHNTVILTDSLSALQSLEGEPSDVSMTKLWDDLNTLATKHRIVLQWIPAHTGIAGNEIADLLAKSGSKMPQPSTATSFKESKTLLKHNATQKWKSRNKHYDSVTDNMQLLDRESQVIIFRLRTGHCLLNKHKKNLRLLDTAACQCGALEQTPVHILQHCSHFEEARDHIWEESVPIEQKLWGSVEDLLRTSNFVRLTGLDV